MVRKARRWASRAERAPAPVAATCGPRSRATARSPRAKAARVARRLANPASAIFTWCSEHMASQKRGGPIITCGPISRRSSRTVSGSSGKFTVAPACRAMATLRSCSPTQAKGRNETMSSVAWTGSTSVRLAAMARRFWWLIIAALATPVVPEV